MDLVCVQPKFNETFDFHPCSQSKVLWQILPRNREAENYQELAILRQRAFVRGSCCHLAYGVYNILYYIYIYKYIYEYVYI